MDSSTKRLFWPTFIAALALLAVAYWLAGRWWAAVLIPALALAALSLQRSTGRCWPSVWLGAGVTVAAAGVLAGASPALLLAAVCAALFCWDLASRPGSARTRQDISLLSAAVTAGLLVGEVGLRLRLALPFGVTVVTGLLALFALYRFSQRGE